MPPQVLLVKRDHRIQFALLKRLFLAALVCIAARVHAAEVEPTGMPADRSPQVEVRRPQADSEYEQTIRPLLAQYCLDCHSTENREGELDLERFTTVELLRGDLAPWQRVAEMLDNGEMPPEDAEQPTHDQRQQLKAWVGDFLDAESLARAGDPGRVLMRRLSNAEYNYTVRDLTGVDLRPAREFPADGAAGEGFTNTGQALVMSPSLLDKYLDAANEIAAHAVLLPDGFGFSTSHLRQDWADERIAAIRQLYAQYTDQTGRIQLVRFFQAMRAYRQRPDADQVSLEEFALREGLSPRYLRSLWQVFHEPHPSLLLNALRARWQTLGPDEFYRLVVDIEQWNRELWKFNNVSSFQPWLEPNHIGLTEARSFQFRYPAPSAGRAPVLYLQALDLQALDGGDGNRTDVAIWKQPRFVADDIQPIYLRDAVKAAERLRKGFHAALADTAKYLAAAAELRSGQADATPQSLADKHGIDVAVLQGWIDYLVWDVGHPASGHHHLSQQLTGIGGNPLLNGWTAPHGPTFIANGSDQPLRVEPKTLSGTRSTDVGRRGDSELGQDLGQDNSAVVPPRGVVVRPAPGRPVTVGWRSPMNARGRVRVDFQAADAQVGCGNGVKWSIQARLEEQPDIPLPSGIIGDGQTAAISPIQWLPVLPGEMISLVIEAHDDDAEGDWTRVEMVVHETDHGNRIWRLGSDVSRNIAVGNPVPDGAGIPDIWHIVQGRDFSHTPAKRVIPAGSLAERCKEIVADRERHGELDEIAARIQTLLTTAQPPGAENDPDTILYHQLVSPDGPLLDHVSVDQFFVDDVSLPDGEGAVSVPLHRAGSTDTERAQFGLHPQGGAIDAQSLVVTAPAVLEVRIPSRLVAGRQFVVDGALAAGSGPESSVQLQLSTSPPQDGVVLLPGVPVLTPADSPARTRLQDSIDEFRRWFPPAACYRQIVPIGEEVTLALQHREDDHLRRLVLDEEQTQHLDTLWNELSFVSRSALTIQEGFDVLLQFMAEYEPHRARIRQGAEAFQQELIAAEPRQLNALVEFATRAFRRPLTAKEETELRELYASLRGAETAHDDAVRTLLARVLTSPHFLYRVEQPAPSDTSQPVSEFELASRLSYFLWSSMPDAELLRIAEQGGLHDAGTIVAQAQRMLRDDRVRGLVIEFAAQWLHVRGFDTHDEKNAALYPTFDAELRREMYEETILFFTDLFRQDRSVLGILNARHTFLNESLAAHYGVPGVEGDQWRRVDGVDAYSRGGILTLGTVLTKQAGASRTSPVLRGTWILETVLGQQLPRPPANVPVLPDEATDTEGMTVRQLVEQHVSVAECAACHVKIDPYGFALERFDAIGRYRETDRAGRPLDTRVRLPSGVDFDGLDGLRDYLLNEHQDQILRNFCKKLLGYALGRSVTLSDEPLLDAVVATLENNDYRFSTAIEEIVTSPQFRNHRGIDVTGN